MLKFKPGDLVRIKTDVTIEGKELLGSAALVVGLEYEIVPKDLRESLNREVSYVIIVNDLQTYVWEDEIEQLEDS